MRHYVDPQSLLHIKRVKVVCLSSFCRSAVHRSGPSVSYRAFCVSHTTFPSTAPHPIPNLPRTFLYLPRCPPPAVIDASRPRQRRPRRHDLPSPWTSSVPTPHQRCRNRLPRLLCSSALRSPRRRRPAGWLGRRRNAHLSR
jgi:hypothetical protein